MCCGGGHVTSVGVTRAQAAWEGRPRSTLRRWADALDRWADSFNSRPAALRPAVEAAPFVAHWPEGVTVVQLDDDEAPLAIGAAPLALEAARLDVWSVSSRVHGHETVPHPVP